MATTTKPRPHLVKTFLSDEQLDLLSQVAVYTGEEKSLSSAIRTLLNVYGTRYIESLTAE